MYVIRSGVSRPRPVGRLRGCSRPAPGISLTLNGVAAPAPNTQFPSKNLRLRSGYNAVNIKVVGVRDFDNFERAVSRRRSHAFFQYRERCTPSRRLASNRPRPLVRSKWSICTENSYDVEYVIDVEGNDYTSRLTIMRVPSTSNMSPNLARTPILSHYPNLSPSIC